MPDDQNAFVLYAKAISKAQRDRSIENRLLSAPYAWPAATDAEALDYLKRNAESRRDRGTFIIYSPRRSKITYLSPEQIRTRRSDERDSESIHSKSVRNGRCVQNFDDLQTDQR